MSLPVRHEEGRRVHQGSVSREQERNNAGSRRLLAAPEGAPGCAKLPEGSPLMCNLHSTFTDQATIRSLFDADMDSCCVPS